MRPSFITIKTFFSTLLRQGLLTFRHATNLLVYLIFPLLLVNCATTSPSSPTVQEQRVLYRAKIDKTIASLYAPAFQVDNYNRAYNRIGSPKAISSTDEAVLVQIDPDQPAIYFEQQEFQTENGHYTNLIYRVHFSEIPPWHLTSGQNVGLITIITLNKAQKPVLYTTVQTCGCFLAFIPTSNLPPQSFPKNWQTDKQKVYGEVLPGILGLPNTEHEHLVVISIKGKTHRVQNLTVLDTAKNSQIRTIVTPILPITTLKRLEVNETTVSFFESSGRRKGHVKNSRKPWEMTFLSLLALDPYVGEDKDYGPSAETGTIFYTSLKPWARRASDMADFPKFLKYWGWNL